jgi:hypothetical protein
MDLVNKLLAIIGYIFGKVVTMFLICLYLFVGSMGLIILAGLSYGAVKETIKLYNGEKPSE